MEVQPLEFITLVMVSFRVWEESGRCVCVGGDVPLLEEYFCTGCAGLGTRPLLICLFGQLCSPLTAVLKDTLIVMYTHTA